MSEHTRAQSNSETDPKLRHEFVGMMFAVAIGEVGLQTATLVRAGNWVHFLPAYSHLVLATILIATSWVGWTLSPSPGARKDVRGVLEWEFVVLLFDVVLVIFYFILVKSVDFKGEDSITLDASAKPETFWMLVIFIFYFIWDIVAKGKGLVKKENWVRVAVTAICLSLVYVTKRIVQDADPPHVLTADFALLALVLLFRALKDLASALYPSKPIDGAERQKKKKWAIVWSVLFGICLLLGWKWTVSWPLPNRIVREISPDQPKKAPSPAVIRSLDTPTAKPSE